MECGEGMWGLHVVVAGRACWCVCVCVCVRVRSGQELGLNKTKLVKETVGAHELVAGPSQTYRKSRS